MRIPNFIGAVAAAVIVVNAAPADQLNAASDATLTATPSSSPATVTVTVTLSTSILRKDHYLTSTWTPTQADAPPLPTQLCVFTKEKHGYHIRVWGKNYEPRFIEDHGRDLIWDTGECLGHNKYFRYLPHNKTSNPDDWQFVYAYSRKRSIVTQDEGVCAGKVILENGGRNANPKNPKRVWHDVCTLALDFPPNMPDPVGPDLHYEE